MPLCVYTVFHVSLQHMTVADGLGFGWLKLLTGRLLPDEKVSECKRAVLNEAITVHFSWTIITDHIKLTTPV